MLGRGGSEFVKPTLGEKGGFLEQQKLAREQRALTSKQERSAVIIQAWIRGLIQKRAFSQLLVKNLDRAIGYREGALLSDYQPVIKPATEVYKATRPFLMFSHRDDKVPKRFECLCKYILLSLSSDVMKDNYLSLLLKKDLSVGWLDHIQKLLVRTMSYLPTLSPENATDLRTVNTLLTVLVSFTSTANWKILNGPSANVLRPAMNQLCLNIIKHLSNKFAFKYIEQILFKGIVKTKPVFKKATLAAIATLILRVYQTCEFSESSTRELLLHILSIPSVVYHLDLITNDIYLQYISTRVFHYCLTFLGNNDNLQAIAVTLEGNRTICLIGNLLQLGLTEMESILNNLCLFNNVIMRLLEVCGEFMMGKKGNKSHWHPILGWSAQQFNYNEAVPYLTRQLQLLWDVKSVRILFSEMMEFGESFSEPSANPDDVKKKSSKKKEKKPVALKLNSSLIQNTCSTCSMYQTVVNILVQLQTEALSGLAFNPDLLSYLWRLIQAICGGITSPKPLIDSMKASTSSSPLLISILSLFCDTAIMLFMILDDFELYDCQKPFRLDDFVNMSEMLNLFVFRTIWQDVIDWKTADNDSIFNSTLSLLQLLYERDCRRAYAPPNHWLIKDIRASQFISSIDKGNKTAQYLLQKVPHILPHKERVILFRKWVLAEKESLDIGGSASLSPNITFITVYRHRMLEDGFRQLSGIGSLALKGVIRVKFVNEQGLDEAGIDQDGVFKEFLEEIIKRVFDPSLNLFKVTTEQKLYPSPTSSLTEYHLKLFEFVGKMLGKAVYEGIVVDVPFAPFFLSQVLDNQKSSMYSYLDELPSLDAELYKNLTYVKHYDGDVSDLDLNFSYDEDFMGRLKNYELKPGGSTIPVTNENKISYVHYMALFKMHTQIMEQTNAFITGFRSIVNYDWLKMFSTPEVQKLISGDTGTIDLSDLRKHTQYYGGFHGNHKVVSWLWDILEKDFDEKERALFLKFVTSCSKPPLLGFAQLEPPFSIRCVEVADDQDTGDTLGSVLKGFFSIRKNKEPAGRLPTSSTCFNLLKLPNYSKKSVLREKLRYSIHSNTGFELS